MNDFINSFELIFVDMSAPILWQRQHDLLSFVEEALKRDCKLLRLAIEKISPAIPDDAWKRNQFVCYLKLHLDFAHRHHYVEEQLLVPYLAKLGVNVSLSLLQENRINRYMDLLEEAALALDPAADALPDQLQRSIQSLQGTLRDYEAVLVRRVAMFESDIYPRLAEVPLAEYEDNVLSRIPDKDDWNHLAVFLPWVMSSDSHFEEYYGSTLPVVTRAMYNMSWRPTWDQERAYLLVSIYDLTVPPPALRTDQNCIIC